MKLKSEKIELLEGYTDETGKTHKKVEITKLITAGEYFFIEKFWGGASPTTLSAYLLNHGITKFGELEMPISTDKLLELYRDDFEDLVSAYNRFTEQNGLPEAIDGQTLKLAFGVTIKKTIYDIVEFGKNTTGFDEVESEVKGLTGNKAMAFLAGKEVVRLRQSAGKKVLDGELGIEIIESMYLIDVLGLMEQSKIWKRLSRILKMSERTKPENS